MSRLLEYTRVKEWMSSKVPMLIGIYVFFAYRNNTGAHLFTVEIIVFFLFVIMFLAISYVVNDFFDIESDKIAGKKKIIANMSLGQIWASIAVMAAVGISPILFVSKNIYIAILVILLIYLSGLAYSVPGLRFKEKGVLGLIECAFAQRCMPLLVILLLIDIDKGDIFLLIIWVFISFFDGLRYILIHQIIDKENDLKSGISTYVSQTDNNNRKVVSVLLILEIALCALVLSFIGISCPIIIISGCILSICLGYFIYKVLCVYAQKDWLTTFDSVPLEAFLNIIFPIMLGFCLGKSNYAGYIMSGLIVIICWQPLKIKLGLARIYTSSKRKARHEKV